MCAALNRKKKFSPSFDRLMRLVLTLGFAVLGLCAAQAQVLRIGAQKTGTFAWELDVIRAHGLDKAAGLTLEVTDLATTEAGKIALSGGTVDMILSDWLWVSRERGLGQNITFYPYSSAIGALMVPEKDGAHQLSDLKGKTLGIAGGPVDKSWLLLQAYAQKSGFDIAHDTRPVFGAPPLLAEKAAQGELDAPLQFWNFAADLELRGFHPLLDMRMVEKGLGASDNVAMVGYVFHDDFAAKNADLIRRFLNVTRQAKEILLYDEAEWLPIMARLKQSAPMAAALYRQRYSEGIPRRALANEEADARLLYQTLAKLGGPELVGAATELDPGTYYKSVP